jgi:hypothetical protein
MLAVSWALVGTLVGVLAVVVALLTWLVPRHPTVGHEADVGVDHVDALPGGRYAVSLFNRGAAHATHVHAFIDRAGVQTTFDAEHLSEPVLFDSIPTGAKSRTKTLQLVRDVPEGQRLSVWTAWRDGRRSWLDSPPTESTAEVPPPSKLAVAEPTLQFVNATQLPPDEALLYDPATDTFVWGDGHGHPGIMQGLRAEGRDPLTMTAGRVFADGSVELYSDSLPARARSRLVARARIEGIELLKARGQTSD